MIADFVSGLCVFVVLMWVLYYLGLPAWDQAEEARKAATERHVAQMSPDVREAIQQK